MNAATIMSFPVYESPEGKSFTCIAWAAQSTVAEESNPVLTEWYIFEEVNIDGETVYYGLQQDRRGDRLCRFKKSELMKINGMQIVEDITILSQLYPPVKWKRLI